MIAKTHNLELSEGPFGENPMVKGFFYFLNCNQPFISLLARVSAGHYYSVGPFSGFLKCLKKELKGRYTQIDYLILFIDVKSYALKNQVFLQVGLLLIVLTVDFINSFLLRDLFSRVLLPFFLPLQIPLLYFRGE